MGSAVTIEPLNEALPGPCDSCGRESRTVWGLASMDGRIVAAYYVRWTPGQVEHGADFDFVLGDWGEQAGAADRCAVALSYRLLESGPAFMVVDAAERPVGDGGLAARALTRSDVVGTPLAEQAFAIADAVLAADRRTAEILGGWTVRQGDAGDPAARGDGRGARRLDPAWPSREPEGRMRFAIGCIALMTMAAAGAAQGATRALEGWGALRFGMSTAEVLQAAGPKAASEDTLLSGPVVVWSGVDEGTPVQVVAFVPDGRLHAVKLYLPDLHHTNEEQCYARLDAAVEALSRRHGPPDEMTVGDAAGEHVSGWRAIFRFADGATIVAEAELQETHLTCTTDVTYDANR